MSILPVTSDSGTYRVQGGVRSLDKLVDVPFVDVVATRSAGGRFLTLLCVNCSLKQDTTTNFDLGPMRAIGPVEVQQIKSASRYE